MNALRCRRCHRRSRMRHGVRHIEWNWEEGPRTQTQSNVKLEHKLGHYWVAWACIDEVPDEILACVRTRFGVDAGGIVTHLGAEYGLREFGIELYL